MQEKINELKSLLIEIWDNYEDFGGDFFKIDDKLFFKIESYPEAPDEAALVIEEYEKNESENKYLGGYLVPGRCIESDKLLEIVCEDVLIKKLHRLS